MRQQSGRVQEEDLSFTVSRERISLQVLWANLGEPQVDYYRWMEYPLALSLLGAQRGDTILDVGSANTIFPLALVSKGCEVCAVDIRPEVHEMRSGYARLRERSRFGSGSLRTEIQDATRLDHPDGQFDMVTMISTIEHIPNDSKAIMESSRVLKPGGVCLITTPFRRKYREINSYPEVAAKMWGQREYDRKAIIERVIYPSHLVLEKAAYFGERLQFSALWYLVPYPIRKRLSNVSSTASRLFVHASLLDSFSSQGIVLRLRKEA